MHLNKKEVHKPISKVFVFTLLTNEFIGNKLLTMAFTHLMKRVPCALRGKPKIFTNKEVHNESINEHQLS